MRSFLGAAQAASPESVTIRYKADIMGLWIPESLAPLGFWNDG
jgi:hypothetical protein